MRLELTDPTHGHSDPTRYWTQANIREACPEVLSPLCWSLWIQTSSRCTPACWYDFGLLGRGEVTGSEDPNLITTGIFFGRQAINVDLVRRIIARAPGGDPDEFERDIIGAVRDNAPPVPQAPRRQAFIAMRMPKAIIRQRRGVQAMHDGQLAWWRAEVLGERGTMSPLELLVEADRRFVAAMHLHLYSRTTLLPGAQGPLTTMATTAGGQELATRLLGGLGRTAESELANDLWRLSRGSLELAEFVRCHGFHGPSEGNPIARVWREEPGLVGALAAAYAQRPDSQAPAERERAAADMHRAALAEVQERLSPARRRQAGMLLSMLRTQIRYLGLGKASFVMAIDGMRAAARRIGAEWVAQGMAEDPDDAFFLTLSEHRGPVPENLAEVVAFRKAKRAEYQSLELPLSWYGMPVAVEARPGETTPAGSDRLSGSPGSSGVAEGRVRVIEDPCDADQLVPGEILVCHFTDPSWAALFPLAEAVVIDIGGPASHGAVVSRELGIPCVIGTGDGTRVLQTGDLVRVDGGAGTVEVLR
jgi:phosphohistidine swiveling domain-containing protein